ncbi:pyridoxamine 5'-phosphate oxidase family protein [Ornithinimicrobium sp. F0845]|uniref:pyridoxamine 5'-phosphate oxidase family protein n=1 Tax=Ornithinimicrobium sp. F0845 TaxID=2926412 RepID=UPI001FF35690|nr:pyridoxamine 5'-phosphate oxidase family protein [Ornithinimicrobium sp. F0845]MCK0111843.1 pyridoxamine 5'-phosphate oxidase family protein [Ornithinimicrobium sp. F0845]
MTTSATPRVEQLDARFSEATEALPWAAAETLLTTAELYWLTTVREAAPEGPVPHTTPLVGLWHQGAFIFCTGGGEQKARNLERSPAVSLMTGVNTWAEGTDVVVSGTATRVTGGVLRDLADAYRAKYGNDWDFSVDEEFFDPDGDRALVFRVAPARAIAFTKAPHGQTTYHF